MRLIRWMLLIALPIGGSRAQTDLELLNRHEDPAGYVASRLGDKATLDNTGSVRIEYGSGSPHTLLVAGLDAPGYVVSGITDDGYLQLQRMAEPPPGYQFDSLWPGQPIEVLRWGRPPLPGAALAPSVHFASDRSGYGGGTLDKLFIDIGASSAEEVAAAGVAVLDRIRLAIEPTSLGADAVTGPWLSSHAGAAVLLTLADALEKSPPRTGRVTLVFADQQQYHNQGLLRALRRESPDRILAIRPGGDGGLEAAAAGERSGEFLQTLFERAKELDIKLERRTSVKLSFGPFESGDPWPAPAAVLTLGPQNEGTPAEALAWADLAAAARLLAHVAGGSSVSDWEEPLRRKRAQEPAPERSEKSDPLFDLLAELTALPGVSGAEEPVRQAIRQRLPRWAASRAEIDPAGNLTVRLGKAGKPRAIFIAHMDEIGFSVTRIDSTGRLSLASRGGLSDELYSYRPLRLWTPGGPVAAVMERVGSALLGVRSDEEAAALGAAEGLSLTPPKQLRRLLGERINGRALDDRAGCATLLLALERLSAKSLEGEPVWIVFSAAEEVGLVGAEAIAKTSAPGRVYAVDSLVTSDSPLEPKRLGLLRLGDGAALRAMDNSGISPRGDVERVASMARRAGIPIQIGVTAGGNDGSKFVQYGSVNIPLSFPLRSSHTSAETADLRDLRALTDLIELLLSEELSGR